MLYYKVRFSINDIILKIYNLFGFFYLFTPVNYWKWGIGCEQFYIIFNKLYFSCLVAKKYIYTYIYVYVYL